MSQTPTARGVRGRVATSERSDFLIVSPEHPRDRFTLAGALRRDLGRLKQVAGGLVVPSALAPRLLDSHHEVHLSWTEAARRYAENRKRASEDFSRVFAEVKRVRELGPAAAAELLPDLDDASTLDGHQLVNVALMTVDRAPGLCVFDEQGAGKTVTVIFAYDLLCKRNEADILLVIAPKSMIPEWPCDLKRFKGDLYRSVVVSGDRRQKRLALRQAADVFVTNFETTVAMEEELSSLARARDGRAVLVVDESFYAKNHDAKRTRAIRRIREWCGRAFVLCGTPAPNRPEDLVQQFNIVDFGLAFGGVDVPDDREGAGSVVQQTIEEKGLYVRHLKTDVLPDLPSKTFERVFMPLQHEQHRAYEGALGNLILDLKATDDDTFQRQISSFLARRMALLQICSHPAMIVPGYTETPAKVLALDSILADLIEQQEEKVILWSFFRFTIDFLVERYRQYGVVRYDGAVPSVSERRNAVRGFQEDQNTRLFVANPAAAGAGLTLHRARFAIYESLSNQAAHYLQSVDRIHRRGQARDVRYLVLLADGTIEVDEYDRLVEKEQRAQDLLGDRVEPPVTRARMLSELSQAAVRVGIGVG